MLETFGVGAGLGLNTSTWDPFGVLNFPFFGVFGLLGDDAKSPKLPSKCDGDFIVRVRVFKGELGDPDPKDLEIPKE